jgi:hypothetical protein
LKLTDITDRIRVATERLYQELIDAEATAFIGAAPFERTVERTTHRNGSRDRVLTTAAGDLDLKIPKLRAGTFFPALLERHRASHSRYFWGFRLYLVCAPDGMPIVWGLANPKIGEREAAEAMLRHDRHLIRPGQIIVGDKGFAGKVFESFNTDELEAQLIRPDRKDEKPRFGKLGGIRQWVESVFDTLKGQLTLEDHGGRTIPGVYARIAGRLLALAAGIWHNWLIGEPHKRSLTAYDH